MFIFSSQSQDEAPGCSHMCCSSGSTQSHFWKTADPHCLPPNSPWRGHTRWQLFFYFVLLFESSKRVVDSGGRKLCCRKWCLIWKHMCASLRAGRSFMSSPCSRTRQDGCTWAMCACTPSATPSATSRGWGVMRWVSFHYLGWRFFYVTTADFISHHRWLY